MSNLRGKIALGEEFVPAGEEAAIDQIVALHRYVQEVSDRKRKPVRRGQHPKQHGCVRADFIVEPDLPEALRHGVLREPRTYRALIRFSNGRQWDDTLLRAPDLAGAPVLRTSGSRDKLRAAMLAHLQQERPASTSWFSSKTTR